MEQAIKKRAEDYILLAADVDNANDARKLAEDLHGQFGALKIGMELRANEPQILEKMPTWARVFWDQKLHDIPNSVAGASRGFTKQGVWMFNVMATGGKAMMEAAINAAKEEATKLGIERPLVIAVTLLTSIDQETLEREFLVSGMTTKEYVVHLAKLAQEAGLDGVVASAQDTAMIRKACGPDFIIVNPGIRPAGTEVNDQKRIGTPTSAIIGGADYLVLGRAITAASDRKEAASKVIKEIESAILYRDAALSVFDDKGIEFGAFRLKSHKRWPDAPLSPIFVNLRQKGSSQEHEGKLSPETVDQLGKLIDDRYGEMIAQLPYYIAGIPSAGEPIVDAIMKYLPENAKVKRLYLEKVGIGDARTIGLKTGEEYPAGAKVLLIDDLITKADSKIEAAAVLREAGMIVETCIVLVDRQQGGPEEAETEGLKIISIYTLSDLLELFQVFGLISAEQVEGVRTYKERFEEYTTTHSPV